MKFISGRHKELYERYSMQNADEIIQKIRSNRLYNPTLLLGIAFLLMILCKVIQDVL